MSPPRWVMAGSALLVAVVLLAGCGSRRQGPPDGVAVAWRLPLEGATLVARLHPEADRVEARGLARELAVAGAAAVEVDHEAGTVRIVVEGAQKRPALEAVLRASPLVASLEPASPPTVP